MSRVYADNVYPELVTEDLTLGASGDSVVVTSGASLNVNTLKDSGGNTIFTSNGSGVLSSVNSAFSGGPTLITTETADDDTTVDFTSSIDSTYKLYIFKWYDVNPATDGAILGFQGNASGESGYNETITSTMFTAQQRESDGDGAVSYTLAGDQGNGTALQQVSREPGGDADQSTVGTLWLFNPSSTTYVKHFYVTDQEAFQGDYTMNVFVSGYFNVTAAITNIQFKFSSGNITAGTFKMYGL